MPTLQQLRYLAAVADTRHFRRAAELCHVTQPTLSGQLRELEQRLGVQLVERSRSKVVMTTVGAEIAARAQVILRDVGEIVELAKVGQGLFAGTIRVGVLPSLGPYLMPHILPDLHARYPKLKLYLREGLPQVLLNSLEDGHQDLLFYPLPITEADVVTAQLFREPLWIITPHDHPLAQKEIIDGCDLRGETMLSLERGHRLHDQVRQLCDEFGAHLALDYEGTSLDTLRQMVAMGMGLSFVPTLYVLSEVLRDNQVAARRFRHPAPSRLIGMAWRRQSARQDEFAMLAEMIRGVLRQRVEDLEIIE